MSPSTIDKIASEARRNGFEKGNSDFKASFCQDFFAAFDAINTLLNTYSIPQSNDVAERTEEETRKREFIQGYMLGVMNEVSLDHYLAALIKKKKAEDVTKINDANVLEENSKNIVREINILAKCAKFFTNPNLQKEFPVFFENHIKEIDKIAELGLELGQVLAEQHAANVHRIKQLSDLDVYAAALPKNVKTLYDYVKKPDDKKLATIVKTIPVAKLSPMFRLLSEDYKSIGSPLCNTQELQTAQDAIYKANSKSMLLKLKAAGRTALAVITGIIPFLGKYTRTWAEKANHDTVLEERKIYPEDYDGLRAFREQKNLLRANEPASLFNQNGELKASKEYGKYATRQGSEHQPHEKDKLLMLHEQAQRFDEWKAAKKHDQKDQRIETALNLFAINKSKERSKRQMIQNTGELYTEINRVKI